MPTETMLAELSNNLTYSAIAVYALAMLAYAWHAASRARVAVPTPVASAAGSADARLEELQLRDPLGPDLAPAERPAAVGTSLTVLGLALHAGAVLARGLAAGRAPWGNMYEFALVGAFAVVASYLFLLRKQPVRDLGVWVIAVVLLLLGLAVTVLYTPAGALVPVLNSYWLVIHVAAAIVSGGIFTVGVVATVLYLLKIRAERRTPARKASGYTAHLPNATTLDRISHMAHLFAFPIWTFAVIAGAIWAENSWGRYWGWDPKETWAFITWVLYAAYLHAQATAGWRGRRASWFAVAGYLAFLFNFFGVNIWIPGLHSYAGI